MPPGMLTIALLLQAHDKVSDAGATDHAAFDMRWKAALGDRVRARRGKVGASMASPYPYIPKQWMVRRVRQVDADTEVVRAPLERNGNALSSP
ncbi:MAG: hypothetical protein ACOX9R_19415 [Armatimonadota bacterium]